MTNIVSISKDPPAFTFFEKGDLYQMVFEANWEMLGGDFFSDIEMADVIERGFHLFSDESHKGKLLADVSIPELDLKGCYYVVAGSFRLHKIADEPMIYPV